MNAQKLWPGSDYAMGWKAKGSTTLPVDLTRVKVMEVIKKPIYGQTKERTYVKVMILTDEGMPEDIDNPEIKEVVSRDIVEFWDEYIETVDDEREEWKEQQKRFKEEQRERQRKRQEQDAAYYIGQFIRGIGRKVEQEEIERQKLEQQKRIDKINRVLIGRGVKQGEFWVTPEKTHVIIRVEEVERWLGIG